MSRRPYPGRMGGPYSTIPEATVVQMLMLSGWAAACRNGQEEMARQACCATLDHLVRNGLSFVTSQDGRRCFDPVEVVNVLKWLGVSGRDDFLTSRLTPTARAVVQSWWSDGSSGSDLSGAFASAARRHASVHWRRLFSIPQGPGDVRVRMPMPLADDPHLDVRALKWSITPDYLDGRHRPDSLEVRGARPADGHITIDLTMDVTSEARMGSSMVQSLTAHDRDLYLRPLEGLVRVTPRVAALARDLTVNATLPQQRISAFWGYLIDDCMSGMVHYDQLGESAVGDWVLDHGWYDCQLGSALLVSLCRAAGIPARLISGHFLYSLLPTNHYWAEVWLDDLGWIPFDLFSWDLSAGGADLRWREYFYGRLDGRLATQRFPRTVTGAIGSPLPDVWHLIQLRDDEDVVIRMSGVDNSLVFEDRISVTAG